MHSQIESTIEYLEESGPTWDASLHVYPSEEPRTAAIGLFPSGWLALLPDIRDPYDSGEGEFSKALIPINGGIRRDALVKLLCRLGPDLGEILDSVEDDAFGLKALKLLKDIRAEAGARGFGETDGADIRHVANYVGDAVDGLGITLGTTDDDLERIAAKLRAEAIAQEVVLVGHVGTFLREIREDAAEDEAT